MKGFYQLCLVNGSFVAFAKRMVLFLEKYNVFARSEATATSKEAFIDDLSNTTSLVLLAVSYHMRCVNCNNKLSHVYVYGYSYLSHAIITNNWFTVRAVTV